MSYKIVNTSQTSGKTRRRTHISDIERIEYHSETTLDEEVVTASGKDVGKRDQRKGQDMDDDRDAKRQKVAGGESED